MSVSSLGKRYGWLPDLPDRRDLMRGWDQVIPMLAKSADLRPGCTAVYDQGQLGSCTANAIAGAIDFELLRQKLPAVYPSRLFIYYNERVIEGTTSSDSGAMIRDGFKTINNQGACAESLWPYDPAQFAVQPAGTCYVQALTHKTVKYNRVPQDAWHMRNCLAAGYPFVFGFSVYESFESDAVAQSGIVPMPAADEAQIGGHAVMAVGYEDSTERFLVRNSWGSSWGQAGYFTIPYKYLSGGNLADDFWTIRLED